MVTRQFTLGWLAYLIPTFAIAFVWHLQLFAAYYDALGIYRADKIVVFGFIAIATQGALFSALYGRLFATDCARRGAAKFAVIAGVLSWTFTTLSVAAKHPMTSVTRFVLIETGFTALQFAVVAPMMALAWKRGTADAIR